MGDQNLPLSKRKLHTLIEDPGCWAESQTAYKEMVNDQIFGFEDIRQYDQLLQLLIMVRTSKLSKDFPPTKVKELLNDSLQVLTDDDLSAMVSTMEQMDSLEDTLHSYRAAMQGARIIRNEYNRYNQYILGRKGQAYLDARGATQRMRNQLRDEQARQGSLERQLEEQSQRKYEEEQPPAGGYGGRRPVSQTRPAKAGPGELYSAGEPAGAGGGPAPKAGGGDH